MESRKTEIIKVAARLFREKGYNAVTMRDLASELGIKAASLYNHIASKQEILQIIIMSIAQDFTQGMQSIISSPLSGIEKLNQIVHLHVKLAIQNPNGMSALNSDWMHLEERLREYLDLRDAYETKFRSIISKGIETGEIKKTDADIIVFSMLTTLRSLYLWIPKQRIEEYTDFADELANILIEGINS